MATNTITRGRVKQPTDDRQLHHHADQASQGDHHKERRGERPVPIEHHLRQQRGADDADLCVGEVDDAARAIDDDEPDGEDAVHQPDHGRR